LKQREKEKFPNKNSLNLKDALRNSSLKNPYFIFLKSIID